MITPDEFIPKWICSPLVQYDPSSVRNLSIPESSKQFLIEAGLPRIHEFEVSTNKLPTVGAYYGDQYGFSSEMQNYRLLGIAGFRDHANALHIYAFYCLDEGNDGKVMVICHDRGMEWVVQVLNSSVPQYAESLFIVRNYDKWRSWEAYDDLDDPDDPFIRSNGEFHRKMLAEGQAVLQRLRTLDPVAFQPGTAWEYEMYRLKSGGYL